MVFDPQKYIKHVDHYDISSEQKLELVHILRKMMQSFVDRAFRDDPVQHCLELQPAIRALVGPDVLDSTDYPKPTKTISGTFTEISKDNENKENS